MGHGYKGKAHKYEYRSEGVKGSAYENEIMDFSLRHNNAGKINDIYIYYNGHLKSESINVMSCSVNEKTRF